MQVSVGTILYKDEQTTDIYNRFQEYFSIDAEKECLTQYIIRKEPSAELIEAINAYYTRGKEQYLHWPYECIDYSSLEERMSKAEELIQCLGGSYVGCHMDNETWILKDGRTITKNFKRKVFRFRDEYIRVDNIYFAEKPWIVLEFADAIDGPYEDSDSGFQFFQGFVDAVTVIDEYKAEVISEENFCNIMEPFSSNNVLACSENVKLSPCA